MVQINGSAVLHHAEIGKLRRDSYTFLPRLVGTEICPTSQELLPVSYSGNRSMKQAGRIGVHCPRRSSLALGRVSGREVLGGAEDPPRFVKAANAVAKLDLGKERLGPEFRFKQLARTDHTSTREPCQDFGQSR